MGSIKIIPLKSLDKSLFENALFITGYQGFGMVGYLTTRHLVRELKLEKIGLIRTKHMPEVTLYGDGGLLYPFELYAGEVSGRKVLVLLNNAVPHIHERTDYAEFAASLMKAFKVDEAVLVGGLDPSLKESEDEKYRWIPIGRTRISLNAPILKNRHVIGPLALTMMFVEAYGLNGVVVLAYTDLYKPDPRASAVAVEIVGELLNTKIDTSSLLEEAKIIDAIEMEREKIEKAMESELAEKKSRLSYI
ncbi:proteasome assembly chaperone family protein [Thermosphaera chiliense]|uniref:Proteasome assembly chaperone family protein n=1 Tax=Thermosphaera chiliense TaxID=3402707 RepID=A0A7M1URG9_9CREN|nr:PAC2 family protein [Thermosphaera aggregans]QOR94559.1 proteasome assembly chaperone family protein [Thermosphaera aggregans]